MKKIYIITGLIIFLFIAGLSAWYFLNTDKTQENNQKTEEYQTLSINEAYFKYKNDFSDERYQEILKALKKNKQELKKDPQDPGAWFDFGYYKKLLGDKEGAKLAWEKAFEYNPKKFATSNNLGDLYVNPFKDYERAEFFYLKALELKPNYSVYYKLADLYQYKLKEKQDRIEPLLKEAIKKLPKNKKEFLVYLYDFYEDQENQEKMEEYKNKIQKIDPEFSG
jgi:tetratricopeptide (TPR) repeat protein